MKKTLHIVCYSFILVFTISAKLPERYNPYRADGSFKPVSIRIEWDNPDLPPDVSEKMRQRKLIKLVAGPEGIKLTKGKKTRKIATEDYLDLWKLLKKVRFWDLDGNVLTTPHPVGVPIRIFSLKMEGSGEKYLNVDVPNKTSRKHFLVIDFIEKLCSTYLFR